MEKDFRKVFKLFFVWQDEAEERWLEQMAREGWRLVRPGFIYRFQKDVPTEVRYRLDYPSRPDNRQEYLTLFRDAGWQHVGNFANWQYFRADSAAAPEVFTDAESRRQKYQRVLALLLLMIVVNVIVLSGHTPSRWFDPSWVRGLQAAAILMLGYAVVRILWRIRRIRSGGV